MIKSIIICSFVFLLLFSMVSTSEESDNGFSGGKGITYYVGGTGSGNYSTIQNAINDASDGDTVYVFQGTYNQPGREYLIYLRRRGHQHQLHPYTAVPVPEAAGKNNQ